MAEGKTHKKIKLHVAWWLKHKAGYDVVAPEVVCGPYLADLLALDTRAKKVGMVEVKASRSDFLRDKGLTAKWYERTMGKHLYGFYPASADLVYLACPPELIRPEEVAPYYGILYVDLDGKECLDYGVTIVRKARRYEKRHVSYEDALRNCAFGLTNRWLRAESQNDEWFCEHFKWLKGPV